MNNERLFNDLKRHEGVVYEVYKDHLGYLTFGVGHLVTPKDIEYGQEVGFAVSEERVRECFNTDMESAVVDCHAIFGKSTFSALDAHAQEVMVNMMFNLGRTRFAKFKKMIAAINKFDYVTAAAEGRDSKWYRQVTNRAEELMSRLENINVNTVV